MQLPGILEDIAGLINDGVTSFGIFVDPIAVLVRGLIDAAYLADVLSDAILAVTSTNIGNAIYSVVDALINKLNAVKLQNILNIALLLDVDAAIYKLLIIKNNGKLQSVITQYYTYVAYCSRVS